MDVLEAMKKSASLVFDTAEGKASVKDYVEACKLLVKAVMETEKEKISDLPLAENIIKTLLMDKAMMGGFYTEEKDQVSLVSTLSTYFACNQLGMEDHSPVYMDNAAILRDKIEAFYQSPVAHFCS